MTAWSGLVKAVAPTYLKDVQDNTYRDRYIMGMLKKRGRIKHNCTGRTMEWKVRYKEHEPESYSDMSTLDFQRHDQWKALTMDWVGYYVTDAMSELEIETLGGDTEIVNRYKEIMPNLTSSLSNDFAGELFIDGGASGNENRIDGIETFLGDDGNTVVGDRFANPSDTYGGQSTALGNAGGTWSSDGTAPNATLGNDFPNGSGPAHYDWNSPKLLNWSSNAWGTSSVDFDDNATRVIRQAIRWCQRTGGSDGALDMFLLADNLFFEYQNALETKQRIIVPHKESEDLGFSGVLNQEGVALYTDFDVPTNVGYGLNLNQMHLKTLTSQLFTPKGPDFDIKQLAYLFACGFWGNVSYNPKFFCKIKNYAAS